MEDTEDNATAMQKKRESKRENGNIDIRPDQPLLERVRDKQAKRKAEEDPTMPKPSKAVCEREERIAEVQLKTFWACFPLITSTTDESCRSEAKESLGQAEAAAPEELCSRGRKQLLARLRTSIIEKTKPKEGKSMKC